MTGIYRKETQMLYGNINMHSYTRPWNSMHIFRVCILYAYNILFHVFTYVPIYVYEYIYMYVYIYIYTHIYIYR